MNRSFYLKPNETRLVFMLIKSTHDLILHLASHPSLKIPIGCQEASQFLKLYVRNISHGMIHIIDRMNLSCSHTSSPASWTVLHHNQLHPLLSSSPLSPPFLSPISFFSSIAEQSSLARATVPHVRLWKAILLDKYLDVCPIHNGSYLSGVSAPGFSLNSFEIYWETLLEMSNFLAPLISFVETHVAAQFLNLSIHRGILEEVDNPCVLSYIR